MKLIKDIFNAVKDRHTELKGSRNLIVWSVIVFCFLVAAIEMMKIIV